MDASDLLFTGDILDSDCHLPRPDSPNPSFPIGDLSDLEDLQDRPRSEAAPSPALSVDLFDDMFSDAEEPQIRVGGLETRLLVNQEDDDLVAVRPADAKYRCLTDDDDVFMCPFEEVAAAEDTMTSEDMLW